MVGGGGGGFQRDGGDKACVLLTSVKGILFFFPGILQSVFFYERIYLEIERFRYRMPCDWSKI